MHKTAEKPWFGIWLQIPEPFLVLALQGVSLHFLQCETGSPGSASLITRRTRRSGVILRVLGS